MPKGRTCLRTREIVGRQPRAMGGLGRPARWPTWRVGKATSPRGLKRVGTGGTERPARRPRGAGAEHTVLSDRAAGGARHGSPPARYAERHGSLLGLGRSRRHRATPGRLGEGLGVSACGQLRPPRRAGGKGDGAKLPPSGADEPTPVGHPPPQGALWSGAGHQGESGNIHSRADGSIERHRLNAPNASGISAPARCAPTMMFGLCDGVAVPTRSTGPLAKTGEARSG